jgi:hypothetical protein
MTRLQWWWTATTEVLLWVAALPLLALMMILDAPASCDAAGHLDVDGKGAPT